MSDDQLDETDLAFVASLVPDDCLYEGFLSVVVYLDEQGDMKFKVYDQLNMHIHAALGVLDLAKRELVKRVEDDQHGDF